MLSNSKAKINSGKIDKKKYMQSSEWKNKRKLVLCRDDNTCQICGIKEVIFDVHHLSYDRFGNEYLFDLVTLCKNCHMSMHPDLDILKTKRNYKKKKSTNKKELYTVTPMRERSIKYIFDENTISAELSIDNSKWVCDRDKQGEFKKWTAMYEDGFIRRFLKISEYKKLSLVYSSTSVAKDLKKLSNSLSTTKYSISKFLVDIKKIVDVEMIKTETNETIKRVGSLVKFKDVSIRVTGIKIPDYFKRIN